MHENSAPDGLTAFLEQPLPYLGSPSVIDGLVRQYAADVVNIRKRQNAEELTDEEAQAAVIGLAQDAGAIVLGKNPEYKPMKWNNERRLGVVLRTHYPDGDRFDSPGTAAFVWLANQVLTAAMEIELGRPDAELQAELNEVFGPFVRVMLGAHLPEWAREV